MKRRHSAILRCVRHVVGGGERALRAHLVAACARLRPVKASLGGGGQLSDHGICVLRGGKALLELVGSPHRGDVALPSALLEFVVAHLGTLACRSVAPLGCTGLTCGHHACQELALGGRDQRVGLPIVQGSGFRVQGFGFWVYGFGFWVLGFGFWVLGFEFWVLGFGFWVLGLGFKT